MNFDKDKITQELINWLNIYLKKKYSKDHYVKVLIPSSNLSKISLKEIKTIENYSSFEFKPDILGILTEKNTNKNKLIFMNRSLSAISLKELGEMYCYSKLARPFLAFIISPKGLPQEVNLLLLNKKIEKRILEYSENKYICVFKWDSENKKPEERTIFPIKLKESFL